MKIIDFFKRKKLFCGIGNSEILENEIIISNYPFEPSIVYPKKTIKANEIDFVCVKYGVCKINISNDIVFIAAEKKDELENFANRNNIKFSTPTYNWEHILEPYLDTEFTKEAQELTLKRLSENGIKKEEVESIRNEIEKQMYKYNYNTMLWEWQNLGLLDVLSSMREKYSKKKFKEFYKKAISLENKSKL